MAKMHDKKKKRETETDMDKMRDITKNRTVQEYNET